jgi:ATP-dependent DNA helicase RecQ
MLSVSEDPVAETGRKVFGIPNLYPIQRYVIANILEEKNQIVVFPTGGGKSLCFQLPAFFLRGLTVVVVPLLSLMEDQMRKLGEWGIPAAVIRGGQPEEERNGIMSGIRSGSIRIAYTTPESLAVARTVEQLKAVGISHLVIDEAHCVSEWGESFRPAYLGLAKVVRTLEVRVITSFTATASEAVIEKIRDIVYEGAPVATVLADPDRPNISYSVIPVLSKNHSLVCLAGKNERPLVVFTRSRKRCEQAARTIKGRMPDAEVFFYHAGLNREERKKVEGWFLKSPDGILTATSAYGMGVDKPDIRTVIHADVPPSIESYLQESGRAGRDGKQSRAFLLHSGEDAAFPGRIADPVQRTRYDRMLHYARSTGRCRREHLLAILGHPLAVPCGGCDVCGGAAVRAPEGLPELLDFVRKNRRRFTVRDAWMVLTGKPGFDGTVRGLYRDPFFGALRGWEPEDCEEALQALVTGGILGLPDRGFWKHRLTAGKKRPQGVLYEEE